MLRRASRWPRRLLVAATSPLPSIHRAGVSAAGGEHRENAPCAAPFRSGIVVDEVDSLESSQIVLLHSTEQLIQVVDVDLQLVGGVNVKLVVGACTIERVPESDMRVVVCLM